MARAPSGKISKTVGQGISRGAYQMSRQLRGANSDAASGIASPKVVPSGSTATGTSSARHYPKSGPTGASMNIAYSEREMPNPDLKSLQLLGKAKAPKTGKGFL